MEPCESPVSSASIGWLDVVYDAGSAYHLRSTGPGLRRTVLSDALPVLPGPHRRPPGEPMRVTTVLLLLGALLGGGLSQSASAAPAPARATVQAAASIASSTTAVDGVPARTSGGRSGAGSVSGSGGVLKDNSTSDSTSTQAIKTKSKKKKKSRNFFGGLLFWILLPVIVLVVLVLWLLGRLRNR